ncbi:TonB-dependent receptor [Sphingomonas rhizophila]|uniref:TonB-dependent receptor n=1 Tax=Sphingomonas rhizophila TaxID=2071607 RepID=A0A7G9SA75_9SPHN|nr:TonB-dependent receptor [Sphingomonas rhizophila]QNN64750.1 TonB-dependent receptor [Sphingomonas rhizophila]
MRKSVWLVSAGLFALSAPAYAQQTDTDAAAAQPTDGATAEAAAVSQDATQVTTEEDTSEIVVTATRRNEALSDVPLAVSAVTAETLKNSGATDIRALTQVSPSLLVSSTTSEGGAATARIRGIGTVGDNPGLESSVGTFIDGVYRSRTGTGLTELGAIDRIEVLRGPQGTLFGRNTSAGLISVITAKPKFENEVSGALTIGNYNLRRGEVSLTGPLSDTLAARFDGVYVKRDGFLEDQVSGRDLNDRDRYLLRGQFLYKPSSNLSVRLIADYAKRDEECCGATFLPARDSVGDGSGGYTEQPSTIKPIIEGLGGIVPDDTYARDAAITPGRSYRSDVKDYGLSGEVVYDLGGAELTSITAYRYNKYTRGMDADFNSLDILYRDDDGGSYNRFKTFSQELRLQGSAFDDRLDWLVGGYFAKEKLQVRDNLSYGNDYSEYANCLIALNFQQSFGAALPAPLVDTTNPTCFSTPLATGARNSLITAYGAAAGSPATQAALQQQIFALSAFARLPTTPLSPVNFNLPPFNNSGFSNVALALGGQSVGLDGAGLDDLYNQTSTNLSLFTHNIFSITDQLKFTFGLRYTREKKTLDAILSDNNTTCTVIAAVASGLQNLACVIPSVPGGYYEGSSSRTEKKLSGTAVLSYKPTDQLLTYLSYSRGYKAGGFNLDRSALPRTVVPSSTGPAPGPVIGGSSFDTLQFKPEINNAFELGAKYNGRGFDVNVALFRQLFKDFQLNTFNGIQFIVENINSCKNDLGGTDTDNDPYTLTGACDGKTKSGVKSRGVEFELFTRPMTDVSFNFGATYADTRYRKDLVGSDGRALPFALFQLPGRRISNSSSLVLTSSLSWSPAVGSSGMRALFYIDGRHTSQYNTGSDLDIEKLQKGYTVFNARVGLRGPDDMWGIELWAQNLFDKDYSQVSFDAFAQGSCTARGAAAGYCLPSSTLNPNNKYRATQLYGSFLAEPRTFGLTIRGKWAGGRAAPPVYVAPPAPPPAAPPPAAQTCADGSVILATEVCPAPPPRRRHLRANADCKVYE